MRYLPAIVRPAMLSAGLFRVFASPGCVFSGWSILNLSDQGRFRSSHQVDHSSNRDCSRTDQGAVCSERVSEHALRNHAENVLIELLIQVEILVNDDQRTDAACCD